MKDIGNVTRYSPHKRVEKLEEYSRRLRETPQSIEVLKDWQFNIQDRVVTFEGKKLQDETIFFGNGKT